MGVFAITSIFSVFSYIWMFIVLQDQKVTMVEAWITLGLFFVLVLFAYLADRYKGNKDKKNALIGDANEIPFIEYSAAEMYKELLLDVTKPGDKDHEKVQKMKTFVK